MQIVIAFWLSAVPVAVILWFVGTYFLPARNVCVRRTDLGVAAVSRPCLAPDPLHVYHDVGHDRRDALCSVACSFGSRPRHPGCTRRAGSKRLCCCTECIRMNAIQTQWTWTITGQYLRALAGMRFPRVGASECDVMYNLVPELATADAQVFWSNGCFTNMLDYGAEHIKLRQLDMPREFLYRQ